MKIHDIGNATLQAMQRVHETDGKLSLSAFMVIGNDEVDDTILQAALHAFYVGQKVDVEGNTVDRGVDDGCLKRHVMRLRKLNLAAQTGSELFGKCFLAEIVDIFRRIGPELEKLAASSE